MRASPGATDLSGQWSTPTVCNVGGHSAHSVPHATACTRADADISHYLVRPRRVAAAATMTAITNSLAALSLSTASGELRGGDDD